MRHTTRRTFLKALPIAALAAPVFVAPRADAQTPLIPDAFASELDLKPLPFAADSLDGFSGRIISSHWQNNYGGSVRALNTIKQRLQAALADDTVPAYVYNDLKREHLMRTGSVVLHEYYFDNLSPPGARDSELDRALTCAFGSVQNWEKEFRRIGAGLGGGSGWVMLAWNVHARTLENYWMWDHMHAPAASIPLLVMDMYEHSYHMDYGAATGEYIDAFMRNVNWATVASRLDVALA